MKGELNMKKATKRTLAALLACLLLCGGLAVGAHGITQDGIVYEYYPTYSFGMTVVCYDGSLWNGTVLEIAPEVAGRPVTAIQGLSDRTWQYPTGFAVDTGITSIVIPSSVGFINYDGMMFNVHKNLLSIEVDPENPNYTSVDGILFNKDQTGLWAYPVGKPESTYTIPDNVKFLAGTAFASCNLTSIVIPDSVVSLYEGDGYNNIVFFNCPNLTIYCYEGSAAHQYAVKYNFSYVLMCREHDYAWAETTPPTCTAAAVETGVCTACDETFTRAGRAALGHDYRATVIAPQIGAQGYTEHTCARCADSYKDSYTAALTPGWLDALPGWLDGIRSLPAFLQVIIHYLLFGWIWDIWPQY